MINISNNFHALTKGFEKFILILLVVAVFQSFFEFVLIISLVLVINIFTTMAMGDDTKIDVNKFDYILDFMGISSNIEIITLFMILIVITGIFRILFIYLYNLFIAKNSSSLATNILSEMLNSDYASLINYPRNTLIASVTKKVDITVGLFIIPVILICNNIIILIGIIGSLMFVNFAITAKIFLFIGLLYFCVAKFLNIRIIESGKKISKGAENVVSFVDELVDGLREIFLYNSRKFFVRQFTNLLIGYYRAQANIQIWAAIPRPFIEAVALLAISAFGIYILAYSSNNTYQLMAVLGAIIFGLQRMLPLVQTVYSNVTLIKGSAQTADDLVKFKNSFYYSGLEQTHSNEEVVWDASSISCREVSFAYSSGNLILNEVSLDLSSKERFIGLTGASGVGKSTLADLLMGLLSPSSGTIEIGPVALSNINRNSWMNRIVHVPQDTHISYGSITENIAFQCSNPDIDKVEQCLVLADLSEFVELLSEGRHTLIGCGGRALSGGQKQRIAIARALYRDFDLLVMDEAFNGIDAASVKKIITGIKGSLLPQQKMILISHVSKHFENADLILAFETSGVRKIEISRQSTKD